MALKWFIPEVHAEEALRWLANGVDLEAPDLIGAEVANALWKKVRLGEITQEQSQAILGGVLNAPLVIHPSAAYLPAALSIATTLGRTVYDSLYVAVAVARDCSLVTADRRLFNALRASVLAERVRWVEDVS